MENTNALTPGEITNLWNSYLSNSMAVGVTSYFIGTAKDPEVVEWLEKALDLASFQVSGAKNLLDQSGHPLPQGFSSEDLNFKAPALYNDNIILFVKYILSEDAGPVYTIALSEAKRSDVRDYYLSVVTKLVNLINQLVALMEKKGLFEPKIHLPVPGNIEKVQKQSFAGNWLTGRRPLNAVEITQIKSNFINMELMHEFFRSFIQICSSTKLREHLIRGQEITEKHMDIFQSLLTADELPNLPTWESEITDSTVSPFSERLMLYKISVFVSSTISRYGTALGTIMRKDIGVEFSRLLAEISLYGEDTLNLMIEFGYLDQLPLARSK
ncbi:DUF3231 family protein [Virgibacillus sp. JSM 102003]|uniref:DUF3231 family protein n=1 Tax=Virgibacillus sp. JSM 102003 TaxID=1562108 RepID=UPI0035C0CB45